MRISQTRACNKFPAHSTIGKALSLCQRKTQLCSFKCEEPLVSHLSVCPVSSLVLCMSRFVEATSNRWNRGTLNPSLLFPVAKDCTLKKGRMFKFWIPPIIVSLSRIGLWALLIARVYWGFHGPIQEWLLQQVTWQWHGSYTDAKCNVFNSSHRSETASFLFISQESSDLPQIGVFQNVIAGLLGSTEPNIQFKMDFHQPLWQKGLWDSAVNEKISCINRLNEKISEEYQWTNRAMAHSAAVVAPWNFWDMGLQWIFTLLDAACWTSESHFPVFKNIESLVSSRLPTFC